MYFSDKEKNEVTLPHIAQRIHAFWGETKEMSKSNKIAPRKKFSLELLQYRLGHRSTTSLMARDNSNVWQDI